MCNFRREFHATSISVVLFLLVAPFAAISQELGYTLDITWGSSASRMTTNYDAKPGQPVKVNIANQTVVLVITPYSKSELNILVRVMDGRGRQSDSAAVFTRLVSFDTPVELRDDVNGTQLPYGATLTVSESGADRQ